MNKTIKISALLLLIMGLLLAVMAIFTSKDDNVSGVPKHRENLLEEKKIQVAVASRELPAGHLLTAEDITLEKKSQMPQGGYAASSPLIGKTTSQEVAKNQILTKQDLLEGLAGMLAPGERAVSIKVDEASAVGHKVMAGDWVDIFVVLNKDTQEVGDTQSRMVLPRKRVLAYGSKVQGVPAEEDASNKDSKPPVARTAVVAVQVEEVNRLLLAEKNGQVQLALRSPFDYNEPSADMLRQVPGLNVRHALNQDVSKETIALDVSLRALKMSEISSDGALKISAVAKAAPKKEHVLRNGNSAGNKAQVVEVIRGVNREKVRY